jgi:hypothetical protein
MSCDMQIISNNPPLYPAISLYYWMTSFVQVIIMQIPVESGHLFRFIPATDSGAFRPPVPVDSGHFCPDSGIDFK